MTYVGRFLSDGEVASIIESEKIRRRHLRLNQVRRIAVDKENQITNDVRREKEHQVKILATELESKWLQDKNRKLDEFSAEYGRYLNEIGEAHENVADEFALKQQRQDEEIAMRLRTAARSREALNRLRHERVEAESALKEQDLRRKFVKTVENERAKQIAALAAEDIATAATKRAQQKSPETTPPRPHKSNPDHSLTGISKDLTEVRSTLTVLDAKSLGQQADAREAAKTEMMKTEEARIKETKLKSVQQRLERERFVKARRQMKNEQELNKILTKLDVLIENDERTCFNSDAKQLSEHNWKVESQTEAAFERMLEKLGLSVLEPIKPFSSDAAAESATNESTESSITPVILLVPPDTTASSEPSVSSGSLRPSSLSHVMEEAATISSSDHTPATIALSEDTNSSQPSLRARSDEVNTDISSRKSINEDDSTIVAGQWTTQAEEIATLPFSMDSTSTRGSSTTLEPQSSSDISSAEHKSSITSINEMQVPAVASHHQDSSSVFKLKRIEQKDVRAEPKVTVESQADNQDVATLLQSAMFLNVTVKQKTSVPHETVTSTEFTTPTHSLSVSEALLNAQKYLKERASLLKGDVESYNQKLSTIWEAEEATSRLRLESFLEQEPKGILDETEPDLSSVHSPDVTTKAIELSSLDASGHKFPEASHSSWIFSDDPSISFLFRNNATRPVIASPHSTWKDATPGFVPRHNVQRPLTPTLSTSDSWSCFTLPLSTSGCATDLAESCLIEKFAANSQVSDQETDHTPTTLSSLSQSRRESSLDDSLISFLLHEHSAGNTSSSHLDTFCSSSN